MVNCCRGPLLLQSSCWMLPLLLLLLCPGYRTHRNVTATSLQSTASAAVSYEMPLSLTRSGHVPSEENAAAPPLVPEMTPGGNGCCRGTLGYASASYNLPYPCANTGCCNHSETVAVIPVDEALGFKFVCMPRTSVKTLCYQAGSEVCTSNQDPDHVPRTCCQGARFTVLLNRWYAAMTIKCVDQSELQLAER